MFEGLAECLADELFPGIDEEQLGEQEEAAYWEYIRPHLDATGPTAYVRAMFPDKKTGLPPACGYRVATRLVSSYIETWGKKASEIQRLPYDELFWNSGYAFD